MITFLMIAIIFIKHDNKYQVSPIGSNILHSRREDSMFIMTLHSLISSIPLQSNMVRSIAMNLFALTILLENH